MSLTRVGFWRSDYQPDLPDPRDLVDERMTRDSTAKLVRYLSSGKVVATYRGFSMCRICGCGNGSQDMTDGEFLWPSGFAHYVSAHRVRPDSDALVFKVLRAPETNLESTRFYFTEGTYDLRIGRARQFGNGDRFLVVLSCEILRSPGSPIELAFSLDSVVGTRQLRQICDAVDDPAVRGVIQDGFCRAFDSAMGWNEARIEDTDVAAGPGVRIRAVCEARPDGAIAVSYGPLSDEGEGPRR